MALAARARTARMTEKVRTRQRGPRKGLVGRGPIPKTRTSRPQAGQVKESGERWEAGDLQARQTGSPAAATSAVGDRKSTRLNSSHGYISYAVFCLKKKKE